MTWRGRDRVIAFLTRDRTWPTAWSWPLQGAEGWFAAVGLSALAAAFFWGLRAAVSAPEPWTLMQRVSFFGELAAMAGLILARAAEARLGLGGGSSQEG
jgi:hypothetical protein